MARGNASSKKRAAADLKLSRVETPPVVLLEMRQLSIPVARRLRTFSLHVLSWCCCRFFRFQRTCYARPSCYVFSPPAECHDQARGIKLQHDLERARLRREQEVGREQEREEMARHVEQEEEKKGNEHEQKEGATTAEQPKVQTKMKVARLGSALENYCAHIQDGSSTAAIAAASSSVPHDVSFSSARFPSLASSLYFPPWFLSRAGRSDLRVVRQCVRDRAHPFEHRPGPGGMAERHEQLRAGKQKRSACAGV